MTFIASILHQEPAHDLLVGGVAVIHHDVVIGALLVRLQLKLGEEQLYPVAGRGGEYPHTFLSFKQPNVFVAFT